MIWSFHITQAVQAEMNFESNIQHLTANIFIDMKKNKKVYCDQIFGHIDQAYLNLSPHQYIYLALPYFSL